MIEQKSQNQNAYGILNELRLFRWCFQITAIWWRMTVIFVHNGHYGENTRNDEKPDRTWSNTIWNLGLAKT